MTSWSPGSSSATRMRMGSAPRRRRTDGPHRLLQPQGEDRAGLGEGSQPEDARPALGGVLSGHGIHHPRGPQPADMGVGRFGEFMAGSISLVACRLGYELRPLARSAARRATSGARRGICGRTMTISQETMSAARTAVCPTATAVTTGSLRASEANGRSIDPAPPPKARPPAPPKPPPPSWRAEARTACRFTVLSSPTPTYPVTHLVAAAARRAPDAKNGNMYRSWTRVGRA